MAFERNQHLCKFTPEEFSEAVDAYIVEQVNKECVPTAKHFALMNGVSRQQMQVKYKKDPKYSESIARLEDARDGMTEYFLVNPSDRSPATLIFASKNWLGMTDKQEIGHTSPDGSMSPKSVDSSIVQSLVDKLTG